MALNEIRKISGCYFVFYSFQFLIFYQIGMNLFECMTMDLILIYAEKKLKDIMNADKSIVYLINNNELIRYTPEKTFIFPNNFLGLIG